PLRASLPDAQARLCTSAKGLEASTGRPPGQPRKRKLRKLQSLVEKKICKRIDRRYLKAGVVRIIRRRQFQCPLQTELQFDGHQGIEADFDQATAQFAAALFVPPENF